MTDGDRDERSGKERSLDELAREAKTGFLSEYIAFLRQSRKWWLIPILVGVLALGLLALLATTGAAPFIYTLF